MHFPETFFLPVCLRGLSLMRIGQLSGRVTEQMSYEGTKLSG